MRINANILTEGLALLLSNDEDRNKSLVGKLVETFYTAIASNVINVDKPVNFHIVKLIESVMNSPMDKTEKMLVVGDFKSGGHIEENDPLVRMIEAIVTGDAEFDEQRIDRIRKRINNCIVWHISDQTCRNMFRKLNTSATATDPQKQAEALEDISNYAQEFTTDYKSQTAETVMRSLEVIDLSDTKSIEVALRKNRDKRIQGIMYSGLQGVNRMFGPDGGFCAESIVLNALSHNYKSGMLLSFGRWIARYNHPPKPIPEDPKTHGKPLVVFITLENEAHENVMAWFRNAYELLYEKSSAGLEEEVIIAFIHDYFNKNGYRFVVHRHGGGEFSADDYVNLMTEYQKAGYRVIAAIVDYIDKMKHGTGAASEQSWMTIKATYNKMCNFSKDNTICLISAHQLNRDAARLVTSGETNVVKKFGDSMISGSMGVQQEVDMTIFLHKEVNTYGIPFLTMKWGKHRYVDNTPEEDKYTAYQFTEFGIPDDINGEDKSVTNIYTIRGEGGNDQSLDTNEFDNIFNDDKNQSVKKASLVSTAIAA